jgi:hypothetical protein
MRVSANVPVSNTSFLPPLDPHHDDFVQLAEQRLSQGWSAVIRHHLVNGVDLTDPANFKQLEQYQVGDTRMGPDHLREYFVVPNNNGGETILVRDLMAKFTTLWRSVGPVPTM